MNFEDERYVRLYTRDTSTWAMLRWEGQAVFALLLRKVDRAGVFDLAGIEAIEAVSLMTGMPVEIVEIGLGRLLKHHVLETGKDCLVVPRFLEAQEASMSPAARQKESRLRRRDQIRQGLDPSSRQTVIYFVQSEHGGPIKIGRSDDLARRLVGLQTSRPDKLVVLASVPGSQIEERAVHDLFAPLREKGEWFTASPDLIKFIKSAKSTGALSVTVTGGTASQGVTAHETSGVTPSRTVPSRTVPDPPNPPDGGGDGSDSDDSDGDLNAEEPPAETELAIARKTFDFWRTEHNHPTAKFDAKRKRRIVARVREGFTGRDLCFAIRGAKRDPFLMGSNEHGKVYDGIETILRDAAQVERLMDLVGKRRGEPASGTRLAAAPFKPWAPPAERAPDPNPPPPCPPLPPKPARLIGGLDG